MFIGSNGCVNKCIQNREEWRRAVEKVKTFKE
jgi:hypothetical protein